MAENDAVEQLDEAPPPKSSKGRGRLMIIGAVLGIMVLEGLVIFVLVKSYVAPTPQDAQAMGPGGLDAAAGQKAVPPVEVEVVQFRAQNEKSQRVMVYDLTIFAVVGADKKEKFQELLEQRRGTIRDRFTRIVRASDPARFLEPDLATLREHFRNELGEIADDRELVQEVLIPAIMTYAEG